MLFIFDMILAICIILIYRFNMSKVFVANTLQNCVDEWHDIVNDTVVNWLTEGVRIPVKSPLGFVLAHHSFSGGQQSRFIDTEICKLLQGGAIRR